MVPHDPSFLSMVDRVPAMLFRLSPAGRITWVNKSGAALIGYSVAEILDKDSRPSFSAESQDSPNLRAVRTAIEAGEGLDWSEFRLRHRDNRTLTVRTTFAPIRDEAGVLVGFDGITVDITAEAEAKSRLVALDSLMTLGLFAAGLGHEVSTPAASVSLALEQLRRQFGELTDGKRPAGEIISDATGVLDEALRSIRDIGNIVEHLRVLARGASSRARTPVALADLVAAATALAGPELRRRANLVIDLTAHPLLATDCAPLTLVLLNLLTNAQQAVADSGSTLQHHVRVSSSDKGDAGVEIAVSDDGPGIPDDVRARIFDPFFTTKTQGTGIGLAVSSELVRRMGGNILVESELGKGATFRVNIPKERVLAREWRTHSG